MEYEKSRAEQKGMGMAGTCGIFITAAAEAMANVTFVAAAARGGDAAAGNKANVSCKYFIATM